MNDTGLFWTDGRVMELRKLHAQGLTFTRIAAKLSIYEGEVTRSQVASKVSRLGLPRRRTGMRHGYKPKSVAVPQWR